MVLQRTLILLFVALLSVILVISVLPIVKLKLEVMGIKAEIWILSRRCRRIQRRFVKDIKYREIIINNPCKISFFFKTIDCLDKTDFCNGLSVEQLSQLFVSNPELLRSRVEEYLLYHRQTVRI